MELVYSYQNKSVLRPLIMGILNVTPDSFYDGGRHFDTEEAIKFGNEMIEQGADIIDVGGESTRPGSEHVEIDEELRRVIPVISALARNPEAVISIDTMHAEVAKQAMEAGASIINDVSALTYDKEMLDVALKYQPGIILMHMKGTPKTMQENPCYQNVTEEVKTFLCERASTLISAGIDKESIAIDPGIGFGKTLEHNVKLLAELDSLQQPGYPIVVGVSRKSFIGKITGREVSERLAGTIAAVVFCILKGANILRVHDVKETVDAVKVIMNLSAGEQLWLK
jgi:dihydropteroate synthase